ncbi:unnamed protein product [Amoebophrya sp. A120]|nr:unnamed protein product [Amoebophrya sp. A120]|eukprot:GSA120T00023018001.1
MYSPPGEQVSGSSASIGSSAFGGSGTSASLNEQDMIAETAPEYQGPASLPIFTAFSAALAGGAPGAGDQSTTSANATAAVSQPVSQSQFHAVPTSVVSSSTGFASTGPVGNQRKKAGPSSASYGRRGKHARADEVAQVSLDPEQVAQLTEEEQRQRIALFMDGFRREAIRLEDDHWLFENANVKKGD